MFFIYLTNGLVLTGQLVNVQPLCCFQGNRWWMRHKGPRADSALSGAKINQSVQNDRTVAAMTVHRTALESFICALTYCLNLTIRQLL